jgi:UDP-N-acetyl-D-mannosaminuronate dehydrogenase
MQIIPCVVGLGYVGLPMVLKLANKFDTFGYDINKSRVIFLKKRMFKKRKKLSISLKIKSKKIICKLLCFISLFL